MSEITDLQQRITRARSHANLRLNTNIVTALFSEINSFVDGLLEEKQAADSISKLQNELTQAKRDVKKDPEQEQKINELEGLLREAQAIERTMREKRTVLRKLMGDAKELQYKIEKGLR